MRDPITILLEAYREERDRVVKAMLMRAVITIINLPPESERKAA